MFDVYGDIAVTANPERLEQVLKQKFKKIYSRTPYHFKERVFELKWISPYPEKEFGGTKYLVKQGDFWIYGDLKEVFYCPRYHFERLALLKDLDSLNLGDTAIVGAGIGPYTLCLAQLKSQITSLTQYEPNLKAQKYNSINLYFNSCEAQMVPTEYDFKCYDTIVSIIPAMSLDYHFKYKFNRFLIFYAILKTQESLKYCADLESFYGRKVHLKRVRPYSKDQDIYRFFLK